MTTYTLTTGITRILTQNSSPTHKRWYLIQNQGATKVGLKIDGVSGDAAVLSSANCLVLQPAGSPGDTLFVTSSTPYGTEAENFVDAVGFSGGEVVNVQSGLYNNR